MLGDVDLLEPVPWVRTVPLAVRLRRGVALVLAVVAVAVAVLAIRAVTPLGASREPPRHGRSTTMIVAPTGASIEPSRLLASVGGTSWELLELSLRSESPGRAVVAARFAAPRGAPALPDRLLAELGDAALAGLAPVAIVATGTGTAVEVAGSVRLDAAPRPGAPVDAAALPGIVAELVRRGGGSVRGVRTMALEGGGGAIMLSFDATVAAAVAVLDALERGPSAPTRMSTLLVRAATDGVAVEVVLTPRDAVRIRT